jgi:MFS family permease
VTNESAPRAERSISREAILSLYLPAMILSLGTGIAAPAVPILAKSFDVSFSTASLIIIVHEVGLLASTLPAGYLIDKIGRRPVLLAGPAITAVAAILTAFAGSFEELLFYRFLSGFAAQMWQQARVAMIADQGGDRERGKLMTWMMSMNRFGHLFSPALGGFLAAVDIRLPFIVHGGLILVALLPSFKLVKETAPDRVGGRRPEPTSGEWQYVFSELRKPQMVYYLCSQLLANFTRGGAGGLINIYMVYAFGVGPQALGIIGTLNSLITLPIGFATGYIMDRWGRKKTIVPGFTGLALTAFVMGATVVFESPLSVFLVAYFLQHVSQGITGGSMQVLMSDLAPERARGRFFAISRMVAEWGNIGHPVLFTLIYVSVGYALAFGWVGLCALGVVYFVGFRLKETVGPVSTRRPDDQEVKTEEVTTAFSHAEVTVVAGGLKEPLPEKVTPPAT